MSAKSQEQTVSPRSATDRSSPLVSWPKPDPTVGTFSTVRTTSGECGRQGETILLVDRSRASACTAGRIFA